MIALLLLIKTRSHLGMNLFNTFIVHNFAIKTNYSYTGYSNSERCGDVFLTIGFQTDNRSLSVQSLKVRAQTYS